MDVNISFITLSTYEWLEYNGLLAGRLKEDGPLEKTYLGVIRAIDFGQQQALFVTYDEITGKYVGELVKLNRLWPCLKPFYQLSDEHLAEVALWLAISEKKVRKLIKANLNFIPFSYAVLRLKKRNNVNIFHLKSRLLACGYDVNQSTYDKVLNQSFFSETELKPLLKYVNNDLKLH